MSFTPLGPTIGSISPPLPIADGGTGAATASTGLAALGGMVLQATTGAAGFTLINGTPTIVGPWNTPNDGQIHRFSVFGLVDITTAETGGAINVTFTDPAGHARSFQLTAGGSAAGGAAYSAAQFAAQANTAVNVVQSSALTAGAAVAWAEIWGL